MENASLISALKDANAEKDRMIETQNNELFEKNAEIKRLWRFIDFLKADAGGTSWKHQF